MQNKQKVMHWWSHDLGVMQSIFSTYIHTYITGYSIFGANYIIRKWMFPIFSYSLSLGVAVPGLKEKSFHTLIDICMHLCQPHP